MGKSQGRKTFRPYNICLNYGCIIFIQIVITDTRLGIITNSSTIMDLFDNAEGECCVVYNALTESKFNINLRGVVCGTTADAGMDIVSSDVQNDILTQDATSDVRDAGFDIAEIRDYDIFDTSDVTDIADALSDDIYSDEGLDSVDSDTIREDIRDSNTGDIEVSDTELEDNARSDDIVKVSDIRSDQSEESSGCSCSVVE